MTSNMTLAMAMILSGGDRLILGLHSQSAVINLSGNSSFGLSYLG
jgi:hypothetical protein